MKFSDFIPPILSRKSSQVLPLVVRSAKQNPLWNPDRFEQFAKEGYQGSVTAYACINEISKAVATIPWVIKRRGPSRDSRESLVDDHPLLKLIRRPNPFQGGSAFMESFVAYLLISGNSYIERVGPLNGPPLELYTHRPDRFKVIPDNKNMIAGYRFKLGSNHIDYTDGEIFHKKLFSPVDDWYGLSPIQVAARDIDSDSEAKRWNLNLLKNDMRPPGAFVSKEELSDTQFERMEGQLDSKYSGAKNAGKPLLLELVDWRNFSISQKDSDWLHGRKMSKKETCQVFNVPSELIGDSESKTYANAKEARKGLYTENVIPMVCGIRDDLNNWLTPLFGDNIAIDFNRDSIEAIQVDRNALFDRVAKATWLTENEKRVETGFSEVDGGDVILVRVGMVALDAVVSGSGNADN